MSANRGPVSPRKAAILTEQSEQTSFEWIVMELVDESHGLRAGLDEIAALPGPVRPFRRSQSLELAIYRPRSRGAGSQRCGGPRKGSGCARRAAKGDERHSRESAEGQPIR